MSQEWCVASQHGIRLSVQITPNAKKTEVAGALDGVLKIRLHAAPIEGKANQALVRFIAAALAVPKNAVHITHGHTCRRKTVEIAGARLSAADVKQALLA